MKAELTPQEKIAIQEFFMRKGLPLDTALTFEDVALPGDYSEIESRSDVQDLSTNFLPNLRLNIPIVSANMEPVSGVELIIALEREGGLGIPPQSLPLEDRLEILERVLRAESAVIDEPLTINKDAQLAEAKKVMDKFGVSGLVVVDDDKKVIGLLSSRDWRYEGWNPPVGTLMTSENLITVPLGTSLEKAKNLVCKHKIEKLPLVDFEGKLAGLITARGLFYQTHYPRALRDDKGRFIRIGSVGVAGKSRSVNDLLKEVEAQLKKGIAAILVDTARAYSKNTAQTVEAIKQKFVIPVIAGNICMAEAAKFLIECGADCIKIGQGPGDPCITRSVAGIGIPQITAIAECSVVAKLHGKTTIGDGGIKSSQHLIKALVAGADNVMIGSLLCGTKESPPDARFNKDGFLVKRYEGSASYEAQRRRKIRGDLDYIREPEGFDHDVPLTGTVSECVDRLLGGLRSGMSYFGTRNIEELQEKGKFRRQTTQGYREGVKGR